MELYWNPYAVVGSVVFVLGWALAALIYAAQPTKLQNRALALYMALVSTGLGVGVGWMFASGDTTTSLALQAVSLAGFYAAPPFYLLFLSTLPTRTMAWLRLMPVRVALWAAPFVVVPWVIANFDLIVAGVIEVPYAKHDSYWTPFGTRLFEMQALIVATLGIVAAIGAYLESPKDSFARKQAGWYAATFVLWEVLQLSAFTILEVAFNSPAPRLDLYTLAAAQLLPGAALLFVLMLGYSILKAHLFDIDLKIKWTVKQSTVAAVFIAVFFVVSEGASVFLGEVTGSEYAGILAAAGLVFAMAPLQRLAENVSNRALPNVKNTEEYRLVRKREVYRAAVESAHLDGSMTPKERLLLATLADELGLTTREAIEVENAVLGSKVPPLASAL